MPVVCIVIINRVGPKGKNWSFGNSVARDVI
jgi:hypothetical protein